MGQGQLVARASMCMCVHQRQKEPPVFLFSDIDKFMHVAGFREIIKGGWLLSKQRPPATLGKFLTSGPDFTVYPKGEECSLNRSFIKQGSNMVSMRGDMLFT